jgi:hypothetical protein
MLCISARTGRALTRQEDGANNQNSRYQRANADRVITDRPGERQRDDGIYECVGAYRRRCGYAHEPSICAKAEHGTADDEERE